MEWTSIVPFLLGSSRRRQCPHVDLARIVLYGYFRLRTNTMRKKFTCRTNQTDLSFACLQRLTTLNRSGTRVAFGHRDRAWSADPGRSDMDIRFFSPEIEFAADKDLLAVFRWRKSHDRRTCQHVWYTQSIFIFSFYRWGRCRWILDWILSERERKKAIRTLDDGSNENVNVKVNVKCETTKRIHTWRTSGLC